MAMNRNYILCNIINIFLVFIVSTCFNNNNYNNNVECFTLILMAAKRRGKVDLKRIINDNENISTSTTDNNMSTKSIKSMNSGKGQEITGVSLPTIGQTKGWEFGNKVRMVCANTGIVTPTTTTNQYYALQGNCPRCGFDLWRGTLLIKDEAWDDLPRIACPTCSTTFSLKTGKAGPTLKRTGIQGFVSGLAKSATPVTSGVDAKAFIITHDEINDKVYCRER